MSELLDNSIQYLKGIGPKRAKLFNKLRINTVEDLLYYFPRRYEDRSKFISISKLQVGQIYTVKAQVLARGEHKSFRRQSFSIIEVVVGDETGKLFCVWFNQPYLKEYFKVGQTLILYGKIERYLGRLQMNSPEFEVVSQDLEETLNIGRITPVYTLPQGITQRNFREIIKYALDEYLPRIKDLLPYDIRSRNNLLNLAKSLLNIHFPDNLEMQKSAYERLSFEEFFIFQIPLVLRKLKKKEKPGIAHRIEGKLLEDFIASLPFKLTESQKKVIGEIRSDMAKPSPMQRLLQGDTGSGKTIVASIASIICIQGGYQVAFMVPTEILARQHYTNIKHQTSNIPTGSGFAFGEKNKNINIELLTSSLNKKEKEKIYQDIQKGKIDLLIGTHALLEEKVSFKNLGLIIIDEQHKFGVGQRALLPKKGFNPDVLIMTATPIPRTIALTLYGDLDISTIDELPQRRSITSLHFTYEQKDLAYNIVKEEIRKGHQGYFIYPVIEESFVLDLASAEKMYEELRKKEFSEFHLALIHGRQRRRIQNRIMQEFKQSKIDILVATSVLEVGIDISNATFMVVEEAQRFGLSQLHQLRGRIGRSIFDSYFIVLCNPTTEEAQTRIKAITQISDGFRIAEEDLKIRGPGEFFGQRQHGLTELKIANPLAQMQLLRRARQEAICLLKKDPKLEMRQNIALKRRLMKRFPEYEKLVLVG